MKVSAYPRLDGLVDLACRDGVDVRPTLLRVITDLYVQKPTHSADEVIQYVELMLGLIDTVDDATRSAVAAKLAQYPAAPPAVLARLGAVEPAPAFVSTTITAAVSDPASAPAPAVAAAALPDIDFAVAIPVRAADDSGNDSLVDLFFSSCSEDRRLILLNIEAGAIDSVRLPPLASPDVLKRLENAALQRNNGDFTRTLEAALKIPRKLAERVARDPSGEPFVVAAKALGMKAAALQRVLLFLNPSVGQSVQRVYDLADLFDELTREAAERMLIIWRTEGLISPPVHQPIYGDDGSRDMRTQTADRDARANVEQPTPQKVKA